MPEKDKPHTRPDLDERLRLLRGRRAAARGRAGLSAHSGPGVAIRIGVEMVAALMVGVGLGYLADGWLGTLPLLSLLGFLLGAAAGMLNVYRTATGQGGAVGWRGGKRDEDEG